MLTPPATRRELIRLANREQFNATETQVVLEYAEYMISFIQNRPDDLTLATVFLESWKASFDE